MNPAGTPDFFQGSLDEKLPSRRQMAMDNLHSPTQPLCNFCSQKVCHNSSTPRITPIWIDMSWIFSYFLNHWSGVSSIIPYPSSITTPCVRQGSPSIGPEQQPKDAAASRQVLMPAGIQDVSTQRLRDPGKKIVKLSHRTAKKMGEHFKADHSTRQR